MIPLPFQRRFLRGAFAPGVDVAALSLPRGQGKTTLAGYILERCLTPGDEWHQPGAEYLLCAASIEQARLCYRPIRAALEPTGQYRFIDSVTRLGIVHKLTNTRLRVLSSNGKTGMGIVGCPVLVADEPGSWETVGGELMATAIMGALGKPESPMRAIFIGTLAPATGGWWHDLVNAGSVGSAYVQALRGDPERWDTWNEIRRCNPLMSRYADSRRRLLTERDAARADTRLQANFKSYRLNAPSADESVSLLTAEDWKRTLARPLAEPAGRPIIAMDLGGGRAFSAAVAIWRNGRVDAIAVAPGIPNLSAQERRDRVPAGLYARMVADGVLTVSEGRRVQSVADLLDRALARWRAGAMLNSWSGIGSV